MTAVRIEAIFRYRNAVVEYLFCTCSKKSVKIFYNIKRLLLIVLTLGMSVAATGQSQKKKTPATATLLTEAEAVELALRQNPDILRAREEIYRAQGLVISRRGPALPRLSVSANLTADDQYLTKSRFNAQFERGPSTITLPIGPGGSDVTIPLGGGQRGGRRLPTNEQWDVTVTLSKTIFDGFGTRSSIAAAKLEREIALAGFEETVLQVIFDVRSAFLRALLTRELIAVERESIKLLEEELENQRRRFEAGTVPRFNVLRAEVELANARPALIRAENAHRLALQRLSVVLGMDNPASTEITPPLKLQGSLDAVAPRITLTEALESSRTKRPLVKQLYALEEVREQTLRQAYSQLYPRLTAFVSYSILKEQLSNDWSRTDSGYRAGIGGSWDLFDGLAVYGNIHQARAAQSVAEINTTERMRLLDLEVREAYSRYIEALELVNASQKTVEQAREALRLAMTRFDAGAATQLDVLNSRVALTQASTAQLTARHDLQSAVALLNRTSSLAFNVKKSIVDTSEKMSNNSPTTSSKKSQDVEASEKSGSTDTPTRPGGSRLR